MIDVGLHAMVHYLWGFKAFTIHLRTGYSVTLLKMVPQS